MQPSSPTFASACHSRPFPLRFWPPGTHHNTLPPPLHPSKPPLPAFLPPSAALCLSVLPCLLSLCLSAALVLFFFLGMPLPCLASLHALFAVLPFASCSQACGTGGEGLMAWFGPPAPGGFEVPALVEGISEESESQRC